MNANARANAAYGAATSAAKSPRQIEYQAFAQITSRLKGTTSRGKQFDQIGTDTNTGGAAQCPSETTREFTKLASALHENLRLWAIVQGDVSGNGNGLPEALRASLFYLGEFTREHTKRVLKGEADTMPLVDINTAVMKGLRQSQDAASCPA